MKNLTESERDKAALHAEEKSGHWLATANECRERGQKAKAEELYQKSARWLMRANKLRHW